MLSFWANMLPTMTAVIVLLVRSIKAQKIEMVYLGYPIYAKKIRLAIETNKNRAVMIVRLNLVTSQELD